MIPNLTTEQRRENLEKAKAARQRRAAILKGVADGSYSVPDVLNMACTDDTVARMKVFTLIKAAPGYGFARTQQTMRKLHISESRRLRGLGANQRAALINQSYETVTLEAGTRVCQLVVMPYVPCELVPVDELSDTEHGAGGFGSTGVE